MKKILFDGKEYKAYHLIMRRKHAEEIIRGEKTVEFRAFTDKYCSMFFDKAVLARNDKLRAEGKEVTESPCRTDIGIVHFYNYGNTFTLDVAIDEIGFGTYSEQDAKNWLRCTAATSWTTNGNNSRNFLSSKSLCSSTCTLPRFCRKRDFSRKASIIFPQMRDACAGDKAEAEPNIQNQ